MPPKSPPGRRREVERWLTVAQLESLDQGCNLYRVPRDRWQHVPALQIPFESFAAGNLARHLRETEGLSERNAIERASAELGLNAATVRDRAQQWPRQAVVG